jgi:hypothetical protein
MEIAGVMFTIELFIPLRLAATISLLVQMVVCFIAQIVAKVG